MTAISTTRALSILPMVVSFINPHVVSKIDYKNGLHRTIDPGKPDASS